MQVPLKIKSNAIFILFGPPLKCIKQKLKKKKKNEHNIDVLDGSHRYKCHYIGDYSLIQFKLGVPEIKMTENHC